MTMREAMLEVAKYQGCSIETLYEALRQGVLPYGVGFKQSRAKTQYTFLLFPEKVREYLGLDLGKAPFVQTEK